MLKIKGIREDKNLTQDDVVRISGLKKRSYVDYESGKSDIPFKKLQKIAIALGVSIAEICGENIQSLEMSEPEVVYAPAGKFPKRKKEGLVAYFDTDFVAGDIDSFNDQTIKPAYYMDVPEFSGCTAFRAYNDSMETLIKSGSILFATKEEDWFDSLEYGQIYGVITKTGRRYLKYIRKHDNPDDYFLLKSENSEAYDDFKIKKKSIKSIWLIHGWIHKRV